MHQTMERCPGTGPEDLEVLQVLEALEPVQVRKIRRMRDRGTLTDADACVMLSLLGYLSDACHLFEVLSPEEQAEFTPDTVRELRRGSWRLPTF